MLLGLSFWASSFSNVVVSFRSVSRFAGFSFLFYEGRNFFLGGIMKRRRQVSSGVVLRGE
jgi:hypothetical protein